MKVLSKILNGIFYKARQIYEAFKYDDITIAEKFRRQGAKIGKRCFLQIRYLASEPYLVEIGDNVSIAPGATFITHDGASVIFREEFPYLRYFGKIIIEDNCFVGAGAIITAGVRIGKNSIVGPMAVVMNDVKPGSIVVGNPAIRVSTVEKYKERCLREWKRQGLHRFEHLFEEKDKFEVQRIMLSNDFREQLKRHLLTIDFSETDRVQRMQTKKDGSGILADEKSV
jgi:acetyltransferase-like isoleucine patch superfamily enzyme